MDTQDASSAARATTGTELRDLRKRLEAIRITYPQRKQVLTNAEYDVLGLKPFVDSDGDGNQGSSAAATASNSDARTIRVKQTRPKPRRPDSTTIDHDHDDEDGPDGDATEVRLRKAPIAADLLRKKGLGHLLSLREPVKSGSSSQSAVTTGQVEHVAISKEKSSSKQSPARERGDEMPSSSPASLPPSESVPAAGSSRVRSNRRETAESLKQQQQLPHVTSKSVEVVATRSAGASHQNSVPQNVGSSADHATRVDHDHQQQQNSPISTTLARLDEGSRTTANEAAQDVKAASTTGEGADEGERAEPVPAAPVRRGKRASTAPSDALANAGRNPTTPDADSALERSDSDLGIASRLRPRKRKALAPAGPDPVERPSGTRRKKGKGKAVSSSEEDEVQNDLVPQTGIEEEAPSGKAMYLYKGYEKNKAAVMELFGKGFKGATVSTDQIISFGRRSFRTRKGTDCLDASHRSVLLRYDATSLRPHISLAGTSNPAAAANPSAGWKETSLELFPDGARQNLEAAAVDVLEGLGVFWADKYCEWLPETVWRKYDEQKGTIDHYKPKALAHDLIDGRLTLYKHNMKMGRYQGLGPYIRWKGLVLQCYVPLLPNIKVSGTLTAHSEGNDFEIDSQEHRGRLLSSLVGAEGVATIRKWRRKTLVQVR